MEHEEHTEVDDETLPPILQAGLLALGLIGLTMIWRWWGHPVAGVSLLSIVIGGFLVVLSAWGFVLPRKG